MKYYDKIKKQLKNSKDYKEIKEYYQNISDLKTYYNIGKMLTEDIEETSEKKNELLKEYASKLTEELGRGYTWHNLYNMSEYYKLLRDNPKLKEITKLTWSHYLELLPLKNIEKINYYIDVTIKQKLPYRKLKEKIKDEEYEKNKIISKEINIEEEKKTITKETLKSLILEDLDDFLKLLGDNITYVGKEHKIRKEEIDILLYSIEHQSYIIVYLSVVELQKEDIIKLNNYMNYLDKKENTNNKTLGIIISKYQNNYKITYTSNPNIIKNKKIT